MGYFCKFLLCLHVHGLLVAFLSRFSNNTILLICLYIKDKLIPASDETCPAQPLPSRQPTSYYPPRASGYSAKGSKRSSKATSSYASGKSGKNGKSKSSKGRYRNLYAVTNSRESAVEELRQEQQTKEYQNQNESANHHLRHRM